MTEEYADEVESEDSSEPEEIIVVDETAKETVKETTDKEPVETTAVEDAANDEPVEEAVADEIEEDTIVDEADEEAVAEEADEDDTAEADEEAAAEEANEEVTAGEADEKAVAEESDEDDTAGEADEKAVAEEADEEAATDDAKEETTAGEAANLESSVTASVSSSAALTQEVKDETTVVESTPAVIEKEDAADTEEILIRAQDEETITSKDSETAETQASSGETADVEAGTTEAIEAEDNADSDSTDTTELQETAETSQRTETEETDVGTIAVVAVASVAPVNLLLASNAEETEETNSGNTLLLTVAATVAEEENAVSEDVKLVVTGYSGSIRETYSLIQDAVDALSTITYTSAVISFSEDHASEGTISLTTDNVTLDGNGTGTISGLYIDADDCTIQNINFIGENRWQTEGYNWGNVQNEAIKIRGSVTNLTIDHNSFDGYTAVTDYYSSGNVENEIFSNNTVENCMFLFHTCDWSTISNLTITNNTLIGCTSCMASTTLADFSGNKLINASFGLQNCETDMEQFLDKNTYDHGFIYQETIDYSSGLGYYYHPSETTVMTVLPDGYDYAIWTSDYDEAGELYELLTYTQQDAIDDAVASSSDKTYCKLTWYGGGTDADGNVQDGGVAIGYNYTAVHLDYGTNPTPETPNDPNPEPTPEPEPQPDPEPDEPREPHEPIEPDEPETPVVPVVPVTPETPAQPETPAETPVETPEETPEETPAEPGTPGETPNPDAPAAPAEPGTPASSTPKTGDDSNVAIYLVVAALSGAALIGLGVTGKKKNEEF